MTEENHIEFDTDQQLSTSSGGRPVFTPQEVLVQQQIPGMAAWLIKKGIISKESQAKAILVGVVSFNFLAAAVVFYFFVIR